MAAVKPRSVTPMIEMIRNVLNRRPSKNALRFEQIQSPRTQPLPKLPFGVSHKLESNPYYGRDGRRESMPAVVTYEHSQKAIESGVESEQTKSSSVKTPTPGLATFNWDM